MEDVFEGITKRDQMCLKRKITTTETYRTD